MPKRVGAKSAPRDAQSPWRWDDATKRYKAPNGRFIGHKKMLTLRDQFTEAMKGRMRQVARRLTDGEITLQKWVTDAREILKTIYLDQYALGRGGRKMMATPADYGRIGNMLKSQYAYLNTFANDIAQGNLSAAQIAARLDMYVDSGTQAFERGLAVAQGVYGLLPAYPADGQTRCKTNCKCAWEYERFEDRIEARWTLGESEHCEDCVENSKRWAPLVIQR